MSAITAVTAQNTMEVRSVQPIETAIISDQIAAIFEDITVDAVKIGMLGSKEIVETVSASLKTFMPAIVILDPVMISKSGHHLLDEKAVSALKMDLLPLATLVTPNVPEAEVLTGLSIRTEQDFYKACISIKEMGPKAVLLKGGHAAGNPNDLFMMGLTSIGSRVSGFIQKHTWHGLYPIIRHYIKHGKWAVIASVDRTGQDLYF